MQRGVRDATRTIAVLSDAYLQSVYGSAEWQAVVASDPDGTRRKLLVVRVSPCARPGLLAGLVGVNLFGATEAEARDRLRDMVAAAASGRAKPSAPPRFPGEDRAVPSEPGFPGRPELQVHDIQPEEGQPAAGLAGRKTFGFPSSPGQQVRETAVGKISIRLTHYLHKHWRPALAGTVVVILLCISLGFYLTRAPGNAAEMAAGDIALIREDGAPRLIFSIASGGIGYCTRSDDDWARPWSGNIVDSAWPGISHAAIFFSGFHGFEILGTDNGVLTFGYRDNVFHWHDPEPVIDDQSDAPVQGVSGRPGFLQYWPDKLSDPQFLALVPVRFSQQQEPGIRDVAGMRVDTRT
jgi:hypothetical protein